jgi:hypothetical protein
VRGLGLDRLSKPNIKARFPDPFWSCQMSAPDVSARLGNQPQLPKFMPPVTLDSTSPHPFLPFQPDRSQFIIHPEEPETAQPPVSAPSPGPKDILAAAKSGSLEWVKKYCDASQTEMADGMGEVGAQLISADPQTALLKASEVGHLDIVEFLVQNPRANVNHADTDGWTSLHNASARGYHLLATYVLTIA